MNDLWTEEELTHKGACVAHTKKRFEERHGIRLDWKDILHMCDDIKGGLAMHVGKVHDGKDRYAVRFGSRYYQVVWNPELEVIQTALA